MPKRFILAALCALPISFMATPAQAQIASYCNGTLVANAFYHEVQSNGARSTVSYRLQLQNRTASAARYSVRFVAPNARDAQNGSVIASLAGYQQVTILLGRQTFNNPSGAGLVGQADVVRYTQVLCPPVR